MVSFAMSDLQSTNFSGFPGFPEQEADTLRQNIQPPNTSSPTAENDIHCTDDEHQDLFEPDTAILSMEQPPPSPLKDENAKNFANNEAYALNNETSAQLLVPTHIGGLKHESADPALFSAEDMDAIFGKTTVFDDNFKLVNSYKLEDNSPPPWTSDSKNTNTPALASPFEPHTQPEHAQDHVQLHPPRNVDPQLLFPEYSNPTIAENPQIARYRFTDGRRRSQSVPPEMRIGIPHQRCPPANMGHHPLRQQHKPTPQLHRVMTSHRHHPITPPPPHLRHHMPVMSPMTIVHDFARGQVPVFHRQIGTRARAMSPSEPTRGRAGKRQKVSHFVEQREPVSHLFETMMGNVEFVLRQGLAGMKYRMDDEFERSLADSRLQNSRITNLSQLLAPMAYREPPSFSVPNSGIEIKQADTQIIQALLLFYEIPFTSTMFLPDKKLLYLRFIGASGTLMHLVLD